MVGSMDWIQALALISARKSHCELYSQFCAAAEGNLIVKYFKVPNYVQLNANLTPSFASTSAWNCWVKTLEHKDA